MAARGAGEGDGNFFSHTDARVTTDEIENWTGADGVLSDINGARAPDNVT